MHTSIEFQNSEKIFAQLANNNQLQQKTIDKLLVLQALLRSYPIEPELFNELSETEISSLGKLSRPLQEQMFIEIIRDFAIVNMIIPNIQKCSKFKISSQTEFIQAEIDVKSKNLGSWKAKMFQLNFKKKTFEILRSKRSKKKPRIVNLASYRLQIVEAKSSRKQFRLTCIDQRDGYYKKLNCGSQDHALCETLIEGLKLIAQWDPEPIYKNKKDKKKKNKAKTPEKKELSFVEQEEQDLKHNFRLFQSMVFSRGKTEVSERQSGRQSLNNKEIKIDTLKEESKQQQEKDQILNQQQQKLLLEKQNVISTENCLNNQNSQKITEIEINQNFEIKEGSQNLPVEKQTEKILSRKNSALQQEEKKESIFENFPEHLIISSSSNSAQKSIQMKQQSPLIEEQIHKSQQTSEFTSPAQSNRIVTTKTSEKQQHQHSLSEVISSSARKNSGEEDDEFLSVEDPTEKKNDLEVQLDLPKIFTKLQDDQKFSIDYFSKTSKNFTQIFNIDNLVILKSTSNSLLYRCYLELPKSTKIDRLFQVLSEIEFMKKWNGSINSEESKIISLIQSEKSAIIYEKRKQYGLFYLPRDFVFLRHVMKLNNAIYIVDKSIEHDEVPPFFRVVRGEINYQLTQIIETEEVVRVIFETETTNGGFSSADQDGDITLIYLRELGNIVKFLEQYGQSRLIESPFLQALQITKLHNNDQMVQQDQRKYDQEFQKEETKFIQVESKQNQEQELLDDFYDPSSEIDQNRCERNRKISLAQQADIQKQLLDIQSTGTFQVIEQVNDDNQIKQIEEEQEEQEEQEEFEENEVIVEKEFLPEDVVLSTRSTLTLEDRQKVMRQIAKIEANQHYQYCLSHKFQLVPSEVKNPEYITENEGGHFFLRKDWERDFKNGGLRFINQVKIEAQKRVIRYLLKKIGSNLITGKSVLCISLPVEIFETRSNLERTAYSFTYAPKYLEIAAKISNPIEQMKYTMTFGMSCIIMYLSLEKPFNPILGETYQGFIDGCPVFVEQICHHPPVCAFQMIGRGYAIDGHIETFAQLHANSFTGKNLGYIRVIYENTKAKQMFISVPGTLYGTAFGDRVFKLEGKQYGIDLENEVFADITFNPGKSSLFSKKESPCDYYAGGIYKVKSQAVSRYKKESYGKWTGLDMNKDVISKHHNITGIWNEYMEVDEEQTWNLTMYPFQLTNHPNPLPSDSNYRIDVLFWKLKDFNNSQRTKELMEVLQRKDKKSRETHAKKKR